MNPVYSKNVILRALKTTTFGVFCSVAIVALATPILMPGVPYAAPIALAAFVPFVVGFPLSLRSYVQAQQIALLNKELTAANARLERMNSINERRASTDQLTGLSSRGHFLERADRLIGSCDGSAIIMIDADHFKRINDTFGHASGDCALRQIATVIADCLRSEDIVGRIGGEEFAVCLPETDIAQSLAIAERIRCGVEKMIFKPEGKSHYPLTVSLGVAEADAEDSLDSVIRRADAALYNSKTAGRNRTTLWRPDLSHRAA